ncbi:transcriptional repressor NF-X1-like [Gigantopelta aegis]|uniref:transcriptional repressor NF-X1-like n=1 Tax=Gigantopelta aegis TaxID=1735272 RepID=UPI001B88D80B|nr:transcriptional repressor NF-X1-like [Gigantopelta aegis]XP_041366296.1 transcriptional repressor NF-X1-like [Gigantopelta aegis]
MSHRQQYSSPNDQLSYEEDSYAVGYANYPMFQGYNSQYYQPCGNNYYMYQQDPYGYSVYQQPYVFPADSVPGCNQQSYAHSYRQNRHRVKTSESSENSTTVTTPDHTAITSQLAQSYSNQDKSNANNNASASPRNFDPNYKHSDGRYRGNRKNHFRGRSRGYSGDKSPIVKSDELRATPDSLYRNRNLRSRGNRQRSYQDARIMNSHPEKVEVSVTDVMEKHAGEDDVRTKSRDAYGGSSRKTYVKNNRDSRTYTNQDVRFMKMNSSSKGKAEEEENQRATLIEQLTRGSSECMVCCDNIRCNAAIWSCSNCFHVFHLACIKKWARFPSSVEGDGTGWRCPACQNISERVPNQYRCFCGKVRDPAYSRYDTPHSCGEVCNKRRKGDCTHPCTLLCHPGPCPPCSALKTRTCDCGRTRQTKRCGQDSSFKCETVCKELINCKLHTCDVVCHSGSCRRCSVKIKQACFCGHVEREITCGSAESEVVSFCCGGKCNKVLECGNHRCEMLCHEGDCGPCPGMPGHVTHCPCGKTPLADLDLPPRESCLEPLHTCSEVCDKPLACGPKDSPHTCTKPCHEGPCGPCNGQTTLECKCGAVEKEFSCTEVSEFTDEKPFKCNKRCNKKKLCGRHKCSDTCCTRDEHVCEFTCGRKLNCGLHKCEDPCHKQNCLPCYQASFDELTCHCGAEVIYPPIPCGTRPPECRRLCARVHPCSHPVRHTCHSDELCPPCTELTEKMCMGGHETRKNIPCHMSDISCGMPCNKLLTCGQHKCMRKCHKGDCLAEGEDCHQPCSIEREECGHPCGVPCHVGMPCPQVACKAEIDIKCPCGRKVAKSLCQMGGEMATNIAEFQKMTVHQLGSGQGLDLSHLTSKRGVTRQLDCDGECAIMERNRRVALALELKNPNLSAKLGNPTYTEFLKEFTRKNLQFVSSVEKSLAELVHNAKQSKQRSRSHAFSPGNRDQRRLIHELAEFYGCETESYDFEPVKNVVATANRSKCWLPSITLTSIIQRELHPKAPPPIPHVSQTTQTSTETKPIKANSPVIDYFDFPPN